MAHKHKQSVRLVATSAVLCVGLLPLSGATAGASIATDPSEAWVVQRLDLEGQGADSVRYDPSTGNIELTSSGAVLASAAVAEPSASATPLAQSYDATALDGLKLGEILDVTVAPTADPTDDPAATHLFVLAASSPTADPTLYEVSLSLPMAQTAAVVVATLVRDTPTSAWSPPSPDPAGIIMLNSGQLLISDSEVNEIPALNKGKNLFRVSKNGSLVGTATTMGAVSNEPTGLGYNPDNQHLFVSDDDFVRLREIAPGADGFHGTPDDVVTAINLAAHGMTDPEGVEYDRATGDLFILDGIGNEIYRLKSGPDGVFGNSDDTVTHFDTAALGTGDPEGLGIDTDRGILLVTDRPTDMILEVSKDGVLLRKIDLHIAAINGGQGPSFMAGVTRGPGSTNANKMNLYVVDRAIDNLINQNENDGRLFEVSYPVGSAVPTIRIDTTDGSASEGGNPATFTVRRTGGDSARTVVVPYSIGGTASPGVDYLALSGSVTLGPDVTSATITVSPTFDTIPESTETVTVTLKTGSGYVLGSPTVATASIADAKFISNRFIDDDDSIFEAAIDKLAAIGVTQGCNPPTNTKFCPTLPITRGQMAAFLVRAFDLTAQDPAIEFTDDDTSGFENAIEKLATAGITKGCNQAGDKFCPQDPVTRGQMAAFLVRAFDYTDDGGGNLFTDDDTSIFRSAIDKLATAGVTKGCNQAGDKYCPDRLVSREEMAAFLIRALGL